MTDQQFLAALDELFELDDGTVALADNFREIQGWSSLTFLGLIGMVDERCGVALTPTEVLSCTTVGDLLKVVQSHIDPGKAAA